MTGRFPACAHLGYLFTEVPLAARFAAAARAGFRHVEHPAPYALPAARVAALCGEHGLTMAQVALPTADADAKGLAALPGREDAFARSLAAGIAYALAIGCRLIHPMAGVPAPGADPGLVAATYRANLSRACEAAAAVGLGVIVEPIGPASVAGYHLDHPDRALAVMHDVGAADLRLSFDVFHAHGVGVDPAGFIAAHGALIAHVQVADAPGRHEPGSGGIDFDGVFAALARSGYGGVIGLEYRPAGETRAGLGWIARHPAIQPLGEGDGAQGRN